jgi:uncharacterized protein
MNQSLYVTARDGTRIAIDVYLPALEPGMPESERRYPTAFQTTRYHRSEETQRTHPESDRMLLEAKQWTDNGYAFVMVDARGTGASFGTRTGELSRDEILDYGDVLSWVAAQPWSTGRIGAYGVSYGGDTAELILRLSHPALKASAPLYSDFDSYDDLLMPGGVLNTWFGETWFGLTNALDEVPGWVEQLAQASGVTLEEFRATMMPRVNPVDGADGLALRDAAILEHAGNVDSMALARTMPFKDDRVGDVTSAVMPHAFRQEIEASNVPMLVIAGWQDAGTTAGTFSRLAGFSNHQEVVIGAWSHGGSFLCDPFLEPSDPSRPVLAQLEEQFAWRLGFFERFVRGHEEPQRGLKKLRYYTNGEGTWHERTPWQAQTKLEAWFLRENNSLSLEPEILDTGADRYAVNYEIGTGEHSRWRTQSGGGPVIHASQHELDVHRLCYTSPPLEQDVRVTGFPRVTLELRSSTPDGAVFAYLEDVAPDGTVTLITEGQLRLIHRKVSSTVQPEAQPRTPRSFTRADAQEMVPGEISSITFDLIPTSVLFKRGHCIRIAFAGHDKDHFQAYSENQVITLERNRIAKSFLEIRVEVHA